MRVHCFLKNKLPLVGSVLLLLLAVCGGVLLAQGAGKMNLDKERQFRQERETWMRSAGSPLALAGLFWLKPGSNRFGTGAGNDIVLPAGSAPAQAGRLMLSGRQVQIQVDNPQAQVMLDNQRIQSRQLKSDADPGMQDVLKLNDLQLKIIKRGDKMGLRLVDLKNPPLLAFSHLNFYAPAAKYRIEAKFVPYNPPKKIKIASVIGDEEEAECPGVAQFQIDGKSCSLEPITEGAGPMSLFFIFKDWTNGKETYGGGRFLYADAPQNGLVILDFNQAHNPYCAYTSFSTCPMPPRQNWLKIAIPAGEKKYSDSH